MIGQHSFPVARCRGSWLLRLRAAQLLLHVPPAQLFISTVPQLRSLHSPSTKLHTPGTPTSGCSTPRRVSDSIPGTLRCTQERSGISRSLQAGGWAEQHDQHDSMKVLQEAADAGMAC